MDPGFRPVGPLPLLKRIPAVHGVPANSDGIAQEVLYDRKSYPASTKETN
jgi:hypothetical protein